MTNTTWSGYTERGRESFEVRFPVTAGQTCPVRPPCTRSTRRGRQLMLRPRDIHNAVERPEPAGHAPATSPGSISPLPHNYQIGDRIVGVGWL
ncbi:transposase [Saccharopolyspora pogona]|uniref:transposase n=1 Tax=Saccharopolyspora pogona TaxID=333966 RepID=UPI001CC268E7